MIQVEGVRPWQWGVLIGALGFLDWWVTVEVLALGGTEVNPLVASWVDSWFGLFVKSVGVGVVAWGLAEQGRFERVLPWLLWVYATVTVVGVYNLYRLGG